MCRAFRAAVDTLIVAQEIIVDNASYPTEKIAQNSHDYRPLGLGFANLGALLMSFGIPYDSDRGRDYAGAISAVMCGQAYQTSARIAASVGPFAGYEQNAEPFLDVIRMHRNSVTGINSRNIPKIYMKARKIAGTRRSNRANSWIPQRADHRHRSHRHHRLHDGLRHNRYRTRLALVKYKKLVGGGVIKIVNNTVPQALIKLGYYARAGGADRAATSTPREPSKALPTSSREHLAVFDCSFRPPNGSRSIHYMGHLKMMGAVQPFVSGAISKTINMPEESTVEDVMDALSKAGGWA